jgi:hypothetical protein
VTEPSIVDQLLAAAGITPSEEELAFFRLLYPVLRARLAAIETFDLGDDT